MKALLFGAEVQEVLEEVRKFSELEVVDHDPEVVICYGGDGTLLASELRWPGIPKVPIRNSRKGHKCIAYPPADVVRRLANDRLVRTEFMKLECALSRPGRQAPGPALTALNEFNVHMGHINAAVRFRLWLDNEPYEDGNEIIGDGFLVSTPFGSTAYFKQLTRGIFYRGIGLAFKSTAHHVCHLVLPEETVIRAEITRGPAALAFDSSLEYFDLKDGDELIVKKYPQPAVILAWEMPQHPSSVF
ncbi:MAG: NAD(+)/NADH kinase [Candidatus Hydrogenedentes bacterium]|nr:NAD(+)/NADH kinase [Candidatus Hydrogenedentota bacterium]